MNIPKATSGRQRHRNCIIDVVGGFMAGFRYRFDQGEPSNMIFGEKKLVFFPQPAGPPPTGWVVKREKKFHLKLFFNVFLHLRLCIALFLF